MMKLETTKQQCEKAMYDVCYVPMNVCRQRDCEKEYEGSAWNSNERRLGKRMHDVTRIVPSQNREVQTWPLSLATPPTRMQ